MGGYIDDDIIVSVCVCVWYYNNRRLGGSVCDRKDRQFKFQSRETYFTIGPLSEAPNPYLFQGLPDPAF